jgi:SAM-dependent methyltransferase
VKCRHCGCDLRLKFLDLATAPPSNAYLTREALQAPEKWYPLRVLVCTECWLVQTEDFHCSDELFSAEYAYFSSFSQTWLEHSQGYAADMIARYHLSAQSRVVEIASNDGYLLQYFKAYGIPCIGVEPTASTAQAARGKGLEVVEDFFGADLAKRLCESGRTADLTVANNVLAHVPDVNDFVAGFQIVLKPNGVATFEFPHLMRLVGQAQFDTIYHEHYSYLSLTAVHRMFERNGLAVFDVEEISTHGGSLRVFAQRADTGKRLPTCRVADLIKDEFHSGVTTAAFYDGFQGKVDQIKNDFVSFLIQAKASGRRVAAYGAAAKGSTLINYAGIRSDLIEFIVDRSPAKQGKYMPGSRIPIMDETWLRSFKPDLVFILPWNLKSEVMDQLAYIREWGGQFATAIPRLEIL